MTEEINLNDVIEQLQHENERLREQLTKIRLMRFNATMVVNTLKDISKNPYFWLGYFFALIVMLLIGAYRNLKD